MGLVVPPLLVALIPVGALTSAALDSSLRHRSNFRIRFAAFLLAAVLPELAVLVGGAAGLVGPEPVMPLLIGLFWGLGILVLAPVLLFYGPAPGRGPSDGGSGGQGPAADPPSPTPPPIGGLPLPDAEQSVMRLRGPGRLRRGAAPRRGAPEPERSPARVAQAAHV